MLTALAFALSLLYARAIQVPLQLETPLPPVPGISDSHSRWDDLSVAPDANGTAHLIFDTVNSLLQHWPNTRYRNGHNIVPGTMPVGTLLYHGRGDSHLPTAPDFIALHPEHSFDFCGRNFGGLKGDDAPLGCWHLTLVATRPLKVLYLDGSSAANMKDGTLDAQDLLLWGKVDPERWMDERVRIDGLCDWGKDFGIDGYLRYVVARRLTISHRALHSLTCFRMEMDFEIMLCDFHDGVEVVSADFLAAWWLPPDKTPIWRPPVDNAAPTPNSAVLSPSMNQTIAWNVLSVQVVRASSRHGRYPGESRVALDLKRLVSFYDTALAPSLIPHRAATERWDHRLLNISAADAAAATARLRDALSASEGGSGVDWRTLYRVVLDRYADPLELLQHLLNTTTPANARARALTVQMQLRVMLTPYILYSARPGPGMEGEVEGDAWAAPVWRACATSHTAHIHASATLSARLTPSEYTLLAALDGTSREICRVVVRVWAAGVHAGLDALIPPDGERGVHTHTASNSSTDPRLDTPPTTLLREWEMATQGLMAWLDWSVWVKCRPACSSEELCYLRTWPYFWAENWGTDEEDEAYSWKRPQPRCIRQVEPFSEL
ncbi:hypothetical protein B0H11DRAFT_1787999 [Mycena galericulata]|nr:hypothetical protein B0H11DRAFT_1787999 [Mycena galericulata]